LKISSYSRASPLFFSSCFFVDYYNFLIYFLFLNFNLRNHTPFFLNFFFAYLRTYTAMSDQTAESSKTSASAPDTKMSSASKKVFDKSHYPDGTLRPLIGHSHETRHNTTMSSLANTLTGVSAAVKFKSKIQGESAASMAVDGDGDGDGDGGVSYRADVHDSDSDDSDVDDDAQEGKALARLAKVRENVEKYPSSYEAHLALVAELKCQQAFEDLRTARQTMQNLFPLPPTVWLEWIHDEAALAVSDEDQKNVVNLFDMATQDYMSIEVWIDYATFIEQSVQDFSDEASLAPVRAVYERALAIAGHDMANGTSLWTAYRLFETRVLSKSPTNEQLDRVRQVYVRQLSVPLCGMEKQLQQYREWEQRAGGMIATSVRQAYNTAHQVQQTRQSWEDRVSGFASAEAGVITAEALETWKAYIAYETEHSRKGDPGRIVVLYERAVAQGFLSVELWLGFTNFLLVHQQHKVQQLRATFTRGTRNCPWSAQLWKGRLLAMENCGITVGDIRDTLDAALSLQLEASIAYVQLCLTFAGIVRRSHNIGQGIFRARLNEHLAKRRKNSDRKADDSQADFAAVSCSLMQPPSNDVHDALVAVYRKAQEYLKYYFAKPKNNDVAIFLAVFQPWADMEARIFGDMERARELYETVLTHFSRSLEVWRPYIQVERDFGDIAYVSVLYKRAAARLKLDWNLQQFCYEWIEFESQCGKLDSLLFAQRRTAIREADIHARQLKIEQKHMQRVQDAAKHHEKYQTSQHTREVKQQQSEQQLLSSETDDISARGRSNATKRKMISEPEVESEPESMAPAKSATHQTASNSRSHHKDSTAAQPQRKRHKVDTQQEKKNANRPKNSDEFTAFVLNLPYEIADDEIKGIFQRCGQVVDVRQVYKKPSGKPRGIAYVEYASTESVQRAVAQLNGQHIHGRAITVTFSRSRQERGTDNQGVPEHTVFVRNLPTSHPDLDSFLRDMFSSCGELADVRVCRTYEGEPKGFAYVEYASIDPVAAALKLDGREVEHDGTGNKLAVQQYRSREQVRMSRGLGAPPSRHSILSLKPRAVRTHAASGPSKRLMPIRRTAMIAAAAAATTTATTTTATTAATSASSATATATAAARKSTTDATKSNSDFRKMLGLS
jgi:squamous cell carcinoma antigen recognized by T-cells 3